jgi:hypothetical protein
MMNSAAGIPNSSFGMCRVAVPAQLLSVRHQSFLIIRFIPPPPPPHTFHFIFQVLLSAFMLWTGKILYFCVNLPALLPEKNNKLEEKL